MHFFTCIFAIPYIEHIIPPKRLFEGADDGTDKAAPKIRLICCSIKEIMKP